MTNALLLILLISGLLPAQADLELNAARKARDRADTQTIEKQINVASAKALASKKFDDYIRLALLQDWLCEAAEGSDQHALVKPAAEAGVAVAEKAVALNPNSSEAHQLLADLLGQLAPNVMGGGMKYGQRSTDEADKAIALDPSNGDAYVTRGISYLYTPEAFGGNKKKAFDFFSKAAQLNPQDDTAHIWLALFHLEAANVAEANREVSEALRLNPDRVFTRFVSEQIKSGKQD